MSRLLALPVALLLAGTAHASDKPIYAPAPDWVKPSPPIDAASVPANAPVLLAYDNQERLEDGQVWTYRETAARAASTEALSAIGTLQFPWQPAHGDLIIHKVEIIRGSEHIDLIKGGQPFTVLRREQGLSQRILDGVLTATMPVEGLRVGDILHVAVSLTMKDPTLKGKLQTTVVLPRAPMRIQFARQRLLWPQSMPLHWKTYSGATLPEPVTQGGFKELVIPLPLAKEDDIPKDAPIRFQRIPLLDATDFADWAEVAATMAPLYKTDDLIDPKGPIAPEVAKIMAASTDPMVRAAAALRLVQDKIRYQLVALGTGNYVPQTPADTWSLRYGDCKAKTLLLLAILHQMGIEAEPVLANSKLGGLVVDRLPSAGAFDHVFVKAVVGGKTLWLDGTRSGDRMADMGDPPPLGWVLPVQAAGSAPIELPHIAPARPNLATVADIDSSAGLRLPAPFKISVTMRGGNMEALRLMEAQASKEDEEKAISGIVRSQLANALVVDHSISFDDDAGTATIMASGVLSQGWSKDDDIYKSTLDDAVGQIKFDPERARPSWRDLPVATDEPTHIVQKSSLVLPHGGKGFSLEGSPTQDVTVTNRRVVRSAALTGDRVTISVDREATGAEIPAAAVSDERKRYAAASAQPLRVVAPADYPSAWQEAADAKRLKKLEPLVAAYTRYIADKPDDADRYALRAAFYQLAFQRQQAIDDLTKAISISPDATMYETRGDLYQALKQKDKAITDYNSAIELDPKSASAIASLARIEADKGDYKSALDMLQQRIDEGGDSKNDYLATKAELQADSGDVGGALSLIGDAITRTPGQPILLNTRCWIRGTHQVELDNALKDCTKAIELSDGPQNALDSRAMVYFRMNRLDDAVADLTAALARDPDLAGSLYMRGLIRRQMGDKTAGDADVTAARGISPDIDTEYKRYGITTP